MKTEPSAPTPEPAPSSRRRARPRVYWLTSQGDPQRVFRRARTGDVLVAQDLGRLEEAYRVAIRQGRPLPGRLLVKGRLRATDRDAYRALFERVVDEGVVRLLPGPELEEALAAPHRDELFIGAAYASAGEAVVLYRGTLEPLPVPAEWFRPTPGGARPDFKRVSVQDYGQTVRLGDYEAATDAILYEFDAAYRRRARARARREAPGLGGSIRRLRKQRGLRQGDIEGVSRREVGRIERGEVGEPHPETLKKIAAGLGVPAEELGSY